MKFILTLITIVTMFATNAFANLVTLNQNQYSYGNGGQFTAATDANGTFQTFCVDTTHQFSPGSTYYYTIGNQTYNGSGNYLSIGSAYLYYSFLNNNLTGYNYGQGQQQSAGFLQNAIWSLEGESSWDNNNPFYNTLLGVYGSIGNAQANANGAYGVGVMYLTDASGCQTYQSQLIETHTPTVPEVGTIWSVCVFFSPSVIRCCQPLEDKMLEQDLITLNGLLVTVVRPFFGSISDSFDGEFSVIRKGEVLFLVSLIGVPMSTIFKTSDVVSVTMNPPSIHSYPTPTAVIRLKGPMDYRASYIS